MAVTQGHGNPDWTNDETILALDLYFKCEGTIPPESDHRVEELSRVLKTFPWPVQVRRNERFRNSAGVAFKLQNLRSLETSRGLKNVSKVDRLIWQRFGDRPSEVGELAASILNALSHDTERLREPYIDDEDIEFVEGRLLTEIHKRRERHPSLRRKLLAARRSRGRLSCDICGLICKVADSDYHDAVFEAHHVRPLSMGITKSTKLVDLALLCANCHRLIHRAIAMERRWLTIAECQRLLTIQ
jgi:5-methylcytosine-specific restriction enzyme A